MLGFNLFTDIGSTIYDALHPTETYIGTGRLSQKQIELLTQLEPSYVPLDKQVNTSEGTGFFDTLSDKLLMYVGIGIVAYIAIPKIIEAIKK